MSGSGLSTITEGFLAATEKYPDRTLFSLCDNGWRRISYKAFSKTVVAVATYLVKAGVDKGDRVALISENRPEWCSAYMAIIVAGGTAVPIDAQLGPDEIKNLLDDSEAKIVFHSSKTAVNMPGDAGVKKRQGGGRPLFIDFDSAFYKSLSDATAEAVPAGGFPENSPEDIASIIYTSGTTGKPKGVMLTHTNFCSDASALIEAKIVSHEDNVLSILPLHHTYAFMCTFLAPLFLGATITYPASIKGPDIMAAVRENGVTVLVGVPQLLDLIRNGIMNKIKAMNRPLPAILLLLHRLSGLLRTKFGLNIGKVIFKSAHKALGDGFRFFASGGAKLAADIMTDLEAFGFTVLEGYGLTETSPVITFNPLSDRRAGSAGKALPSAQIMVLNPDGKGEGEIIVKGPMVMKGYYRNPAMTSDVMTNGWFRTGDIGRIDKDGYLFLTGRSKEVIVLSSGKNIYPEEVEKLYAVSPLIKEICVIGKGDSGVSETLFAVVVPDREYAKEAGLNNLYETIKWEINKISGRVPSYMKITGFALTNEPLPRTPLGKIRRFIVKEKAGQRERRLVQQAETPEEIPADDTARGVASALKPFLREGVLLAEDRHLELDLGLDSLSKIELAAGLEKIFSLNLPEDFMSELHTVGDLITKIKGMIGAAAGAAVPVETGWKRILQRAPAPEVLKMLSLEPPGSRMISSFILHSVFRIFFRIFFRLEARGAENIPDGRNYIIAPNHTSYLDGFVLVLSLPFHYFRNIYVLGQREFFMGFLRSRLARKAHVISIDSASYLNQALQMSAHVLTNERSLAVFPEGGRSPDGELIEFKKGIGILACEMSVPVVPAFISGAFESLPRERFFPRPVKITVTFGRPLLASEIDHSKTTPRLTGKGTDKYQLFADELKERVQELKSAADNAGIRRLKGGEK